MKFYFWLLIELVIRYVPAEPVHKRFEYKCSFKAPYLAQHDGSVPFWQYGGNAIATSDNVRVAPSLKSQKGGIWLKSTTNFDWWEVDMAFRVTGRGRVGADGLAFWYTAQTGGFDGPVFGGNDNWVGLGIFFDSFDNDNKRNNPFIMAVANDGTQHFDHSNDGNTQMLAGCLRDFRNKPYPTRARIEYYNNVLTLLFHNGNTNDDRDYEVCFRIDSLKLPKYGHFGITAATGGLADDHDVKSFIVHSLRPESEWKPGVQTEQHSKLDEEEKINAQYTEYQKQLEAKKELYNKEHPEYDNNLSDEQFEDVNERELRQIFTVLSQNHEAVRSLSNKLDEVLGKQGTSLSLLSAIHAGVTTPGRPAQQIDSQHFAQAGVGVDNAELSRLSAVQRDTYAVIVEARNVAVELSRKTDNVLQNQARQPTAQVQAIGYDSNANVNLGAFVSETKDLVNSVKRDLAAMMAKVNAMHTQGCSKVDCVSTSVLIGIFVAQFVLLVAYFRYRDSKESSPKKFY